MEVITRQMRHLTRPHRRPAGRLTQSAAGRSNSEEACSTRPSILDSAVATVKPLIDERRHALDVSIDRGNLWIDAEPDAHRAGDRQSPETTPPKYSENGGFIRLSAHQRRRRLSSSFRSGTGVSASSRRGSPRCSSSSPKANRSLARSEGGLRDRAHRGQEAGRIAQRGR